MTIAEIAELPDEYDFTTRNGTPYHVRFASAEYIITWKTAGGGEESTRYTKRDFEEQLECGSFIPVNITPTPIIPISESEWETLIGN